MPGSALNNSGGPSAGEKRRGWEHNEQPCKRRASKACLSCRNRKVRCDVVTGGHPCTNCRLDAVECVVIESNRGRKPGPLAVTASAPERAPAVFPVPNEMNTRASPSVVSPPGVDELSIPSRPSTPDGEPSRLACQDQPSLSSPEVLAEGVLLGSQDMPQNVRARLTMTSPGTNVNKPPPMFNTSSQYLPSYIKPLPRHITSRDLVYLADKGAFTIPDDALRDEILRAYVALVYPFMPTLDLEDFLGPILCGSQRGSISLLLFQAVMFAGVSFVDEGILRSYGYRSKKAARKDLYRRVRLLYALECERDHLSLLQAVLLMTYWYDCPDDGKNCWYWTGIAWSIAQVIGIHRETELCKTTLKDRQLRRRIWWSCVMQDRLLSLGIRRPSSIRDEDFDVPQLTLDDFDLSRPSEPIVSFLNYSKGCEGYTSSDPSTRVTLAVLCIELSKLAVCVGHILRSQYSAVGDQPMIAEYLLRIIVIPKQTNASQHDVERCEDELNAWLHGQDPRAKHELRGQSATAVDGNNPTAAQNVRLHQALLHMNYLAAVHILHNPQVFYSEPETINDNNNNPAASGDVGNSHKASSRHKVISAAVGLTKLAFDLQINNQLQYLSTSSVPAFISATLTHLMHIRSHDEELRNISVGRFYQCMHVLQTLQDMYSSADYAVHFLEAVLKNVDINVPSLISGERSSRPDWKKPQLLVCRNPSDDSDSTPPLARAYPSPSSCQNSNHEPQMTYPAGTSEVMHNHHHTTQSLCCGGIETWSDPSGHMGDGGIGNLVGDDYLSDTASMGHWLDIGNLVTALMHFDADSSLAAAGASATSGGESSLFYG